MRVVPALTLLAAILSVGCGGAPQWQVVLQESDLDGALLSVWGSSHEDVYAVGGPLGNSGFESLVVHFDGKSWSRLRPGGSETYWWVGGSGPTDVWMVGTSGRITHWDGRAFAEHSSGVKATLWGVWASSPTDAWAVGGTPEGGVGAATGNDLVLHWDGNSWAQQALPGQPLGRSLFKVWGASPDDIYVVGEGGLIWHRSGGAWRQESSGATGTLLTVSGCSPGEVYAVGNFDVLRSGGTGWTRVTPDAPGSVNGVACSPTDGVLLVGAGGLKERLAGGKWIDDSGSEPYTDLHGAWADPKGGFWAVGGNFIGQPAAGQRRAGVLARFGKGQVPAHLAAGSGG